MLATLLVATARALSSAAKRIDTSVFTCGWIEEGPCEHAARNEKRTSAERKHADAQSKKQEQEEK